MRVILVDDEPVILEDLKRMLSGKEELEVAGVYEDPLEALKELSETKPDCAFLDIEMAGMNGIELAESICTLKEDVEIIFVTAYNHYAAQAFEVNAVDYMLKPIRPERLERTLEKLKGRVKKPALTENKRQCKIRCFGAFEVTVNEKTLKWGRTKSKEFLAYMLQNEGKWISKYKLCDEQWPEYGQEQALAYLQTAVYIIRKNIRELGCKEIEVEYADDRYRLKVKEADWDVRKFEAAYKAFLKAGDVAEAEKAVQIYSGEYFEGEDWLWADITREAYTCKYERLSEAVDAG